MSTIVLGTGASSVQNAATPSLPPTVPPTLVTPPAVPLSGVPLQVAIPPAPSVPTGGPGSVPAVPVTSAPLIKPPTIIPPTALPPTLPSDAGAGLPLMTNPTVPGGASAPTKAAAVALMSTSAAAPKPKTLADYLVSPDKAPPMFFPYSAGAAHTAAALSPWQLQVIGAYLAAAGGDTNAMALLKAGAPDTAYFKTLPAYMQNVYTLANNSLTKALPSVPAIPTAAAAASVAPPAKVNPAPPGGLAGIETGVATFFAWLGAKLGAVR